MGIIDRWNQYRELKRRQDEKESATTEWIERMVQETDPSIRKVEGYRRQLRTPVENALGYVEGVVSAIPGPFQPYIRALGPGLADARALCQPRRHSFPASKL